MKLNAALIKCLCCFMPVLAISQTDSLGLKSLPFRNTNLSFELRATDIVQRLTLQEKIDLMQNNAKPIARLEIPAYNWWNECLHGVARDGIATVFPQAIAMAATWNTDLVNTVADVIATEARAKHQEHIRQGQRGIYQGLDMWTPNINIFRDPRWGRGQETYGEDPFLTARIGVAFVKGLQGDNPLYYKVIATAKHFAVHSGSEYNRHVFDAAVSKADLYNTYLPAFESLVKEAKVYSVMGAYNRVNGVPACANNFLLDTILRQKWGFKGYVVSDCGAIGDIFRSHKYANSQAQASALAVMAGCDLACGSEYNALLKAVKEGQISEETLNTSVQRLMLAMLKMGMFDDAQRVAYQRIPFSENNSAEHNLLAKKTALESMVLLQNNTKLLPLAIKNIQSIAVVGPFANDNGVLNANYSGTPQSPVNFFTGIKNKLGKGVKIITENYIYKPEKQYQSEQNAADSVAKMVKSVSNADVIIFCGGISARVEGEESKLNIKGFYKGDRTDIVLPDVQVAALKALKATGKPVVLVLTNGSALALNWENDSLAAIVEAWYPGQQGGNALADILFGDYNPSGKLPLTFYKSVKDLPDFEDYSMKGRTYKYFAGKPLYPFGYGLSYTNFVFNNLILSSPVAKIIDTIVLSVLVKNTGKYDGNETVQVYGSAIGVQQFTPIKTLVAFKKVFVKIGETQKVNLSIPLSTLRQFNEFTNDYVVYSGKYNLQVGNSSADIKLQTTIKIKQ